ncbi:lipopolysaccharide biosynthesis protein [Dorea sp. D27]|uniref:lipopolysaccharide biosynthesis protein n=1 Tax=Dorea sp. D27 TaxID=658665 RepID=UPI00067363E2|nr:hypothetical protein [Dorea sp. D27]KMZ53831.1 heteropolysaccharide repeat unit export protein [Dorea sp. D27]
MKIKYNKFLTNLSYSVGANIISVILGMAAMLIIPKFIGVDAYGYYQLYIFYVTYSSIAALGWPEGTYLDIGGMAYHDIDKQSLSAQYRLLSAFIAIVFSVLFVIVLISPLTPEKKIVFSFSCFAGAVVNIWRYLQFIIQATNRIKEYSLTIVIWRGGSVGLSIIAVLCGVKSYLLLIMLDAAGRVLSLVYVIFCCKDITSRKRVDMKLAAAEGKKAIQSGYKLLFATLAGTIIIGITRWCIENHWSITTFAEVTLTISIANVFLQCINAVAVTLFPALRRADRKELSRLYPMINSVVVIGLFGCMIFYYPMTKLLIWWLPQYEASIGYAAFLLPICVYECKSSVLVSTYLKTLREEKILFKINIVSVALAFALSFFTIYILDSLTGAMLAILAVLAYRCCVGEIKICKIMKRSCVKTIAAETVMVAAFILCGSLLEWAGTVLFAGMFILYLFMFKGDVKEIKKIIMRK